MKRKHTLSLSFTFQILLSAATGIFLGLLIGDHTRVLAPVTNIYTMLMEAVVYPYLICTLLIGLGSLTPSLTLRLVKKGWSSYVFLLILVFLILFLLGQAIPFTLSESPQEGGIVNSTNSILTLLIPQNIFYDLTQNYVPAIIVFCILFGLALQHTKHKSKLFLFLSTITHACLIFWNFLVKLVPLVTFASFAVIAGTIRLTQLYDVSEFLILFFIGMTVLLFWLLPVIISSCTNIPYKTILKELRDALIISMITTLSVVALPYIEKIVSKLLQQRARKNLELETDNILNTILTISYPLAQLGNFFVYLFVLFAALYFDHAISQSKFNLLPFISYLSSIGSPSSSISGVDFLCHWLNFPEGGVNLYISLLPLIRYGQVLLSVMGFFFLTILISFTLFGYLKINLKRIIYHVASAFVLLFIIVFYLQSVFPNSGEKSYKRLYSFPLSSISLDVNAKILPPFDENKTSPSIQTEDVLFRIQRNGVLRVGFNADVSPFAFYNDKHELVGYDIAYAYALAKALHCRIEFIPFTWPNLVRDIMANKFDIAMSGIYVSEARLRTVAFSQAYFHSPVAFIVPKENQSQFQNVEQILKMKSLRVGIHNSPVLISLIQQNFPNAQIVVLPAVTGEEPARAFATNKIDAILWSQAQTRVWTLMYSNYTSVSPAGMAAPLLMAYMVQPNSPQFLNFLNYWLTLKENDGFHTNMYNQWILIRPTTQVTPRWNLLGWY